jgi:hypothetical protein
LVIAVIFSPRGYPMAYRRKYFLDSELAQQQGAKRWRLLALPPWALGAALLCAVLLCVAAAVMLLPARLRPAVMGRPAVPREEFSKAVVGKTKAEVIREFGPPPKWRPGFLYYSALTRDPATGSVDEHIRVMIDEKTDRCVKVDFSAGPPD